MASAAGVECFVNPKWGDSIPVESVQEIALNVHPEAVPQRYIRPPEERQTSALLLSSQSTIPLIDMKKLIQLHPDDYQRQQEMERLSNACQEWGFFQIVNHGIPQSLTDAIKGVAKEFFDLPLQEKQKYAPQAGDIQGYGKTFVVDEDQTLDWGDLLALALMPNSLKNLSLWPTVPASFRDTVERYAIEVERVAQGVLSLFAENLGLEADYFKDKFGSQPMNTMRMNFYPPCPRPDLVLGLSPHSDGGGITLLLQDDQTEGLQIRKNNEWITVQPIPCALVVNIGDLVEVMTNGRYKSVEHRAVITSQERARLSVALFYYPSTDAEVAPAAKLVDEDHKLFYKKFIHEEYVRYYLSRQLKGKHHFAEFAKVDVGNN